MISIIRIFVSFHVMVNFFLNITRLENVFSLDVKVEHK